MLPPPLDERGDFRDEREFEITPSRFPRPKKPGRPRPPKGRAVKCKVVCVGGRVRADGTKGKARKVKMCWDKHGTIVKQSGVGKRASSKRKKRGGKKRRK